MASYLDPIDYVIICVYLLLIVLVGLYFQRQASKDTNAYFLGKQTTSPSEDERPNSKSSLPWWALAASGMASNLDMTGTMINTAMIYSLGLKGFWVEIRGGLCLVLAFFMAFSAKWACRTPVMTLAEWMSLRFGVSRAGKVARLSTAIIALVLGSVNITYFCVGSGKFAATVFGFTDFLWLPARFWGACTMVVLGTTYTACSGLHGVVWTDVLQSCLIFVAIGYVVLKAFVSSTVPEVFTLSLPAKDTLQPSKYINITTTQTEWLDIVPTWELGIDERSTYSNFNHFIFLLTFYMVKVIAEGSGGPTGYMFQRYMAAGSTREAGIMTALWTQLLAFRWPFITAVAVLGLQYSMNEQHIEDPEQVLPTVLVGCVGSGIRGFIMAGLLAAAMSTFDSNVNSTAAYWVNDVYAAFINPQATQRAKMIHARVSSVVIVVFGLLISVVVRDINMVWGFINAGLWGGWMVPNLARWYWGRLNGYGFSAGAVVGLTAGIIQQAVNPSLPEYYKLSIASVSSLIGMLVVTTLTQQTEPSVLKTFYSTVRPPGFWAKQMEGMQTKEQMNANKREATKDICTLFITLPWQLAAFIMLMAIPLKAWRLFIIATVVWLICVVLLYWYWFKRLELGTGNDQNDHSKLEEEEVDPNTEEMVQSP